MSGPETREASNNTLALDRTVLANERTYQAWLRTGLSALVTGLGVARFLRDELSVWMLLAIATIMIFLSAVAFLQAAWRYTHLHVRMAHLDVDATPAWMVKVISVFLVGCSGLALVGVWLSALL